MYNNNNNNSNKIRRGFWRIQTTTTATTTKQTQQPLFQNKHYILILVGSLCINGCGDDYGCCNVMLEMYLLFWRIRRPVLFTEKSNSKQQTSCTAWAWNFHSMNRHCCTRIIKAYIRYHRHRWKQQINTTKKMEEKEKKKEKKKKKKRKEKKERNWHNEQLHSAHTIVVKRNTSYHNKESRKQIFNLRSFRFLELKHGIFVLLHFFVKLPHTRGKHNSVSSLWRQKRTA